MKSTEFRKKRNNFEKEVISEIKKIVGNHRIVIGNNFKDDADNLISSIDKNKVYFEEDWEFYPIGVLSLNDAIEILSYLEFK